MTFYTQLKEYEGITPSLDDTPPSLGEYVGAVAKDVWDSNPTTSAMRAYELSQSIVGAYDIDDSGGGLPTVTHTPPKTPEMSLDEQASKIKALGLEGMVKPTQGYTQEALDIVTSRKFEENAIKQTREAAPMSYAPLGLATGLGVALADPVNIASAFFPVVGEARALSLLRGTSNAWGRAGVRAGIGAVEGAMGAAVVEPTVYAAKTFEQADYDMADALLNIGFGAVFGAALQPAAGATGDYLRARRGQRNPWEVAPVTESSESMRSKLADDMHTALVQANPDMDRPVADAAAALFDARARTWSHDMGRSVDEYYSRYSPEFASGEAMSASELQQALYKSNAESISDFVHEASTVPTGSKDSVYVFGDVSREDAGIINARIELTSDRVRHVHKRHPEFSQWEELENIINTGSYVQIKPDSGTGMEGVAFFRAGDEKTHVVLGYKKETKRGNRLIIGSTFEDANARVEKWLENNKADVLSHRAGSSPAKPKPEKSGRLYGPEDNGPSKNTVEQAGQSVNEVESTPEEIMQFWGSDNPRASVTFEEEGRAVIRFFSSVDPTSAPHELYHIFRRELAETAADATAPARVREDWRAIEEFVESRPGEAWDVFQEERFAKAGEKFLLEGVAPTPALQRVFERLKQWFSEVYTQAEAAGIPLSDEMRKVFANMMSMDDADGAFRNALGDLLTRDVSRDFSSNEPVRAEIGAVDLNAVRSATDDSAVLLKENLNGVAASDPVLAEAIANEYATALREADAAIAKTATYRDTLREAALCETRR